MKTLITDTNVFIDLIETGSLEAFFALPFQIYTTDFVLAELENDPAKKRVLGLAVANKKLKVREFPPEEILAISLIQTQRSLRPITDKSVLYVAKKEGFILLTGDKQLRNEAQDQQVEVHGSLWVLRQLLTHDIRPPAILLQYLNDLETKNPRLPQAAMAELRQDIETAKQNNDQQT